MQIMNARVVELSLKMVADMTMRTFTTMFPNMQCPNCRESSVSLGGRL